MAIHIYVHAVRPAQTQWLSFKLFIFLFVDFENPSQMDISIASEHGVVAKTVSEEFAGRYVAIGIVAKHCTASIALHTHPRYTQ